MLRKHWEPRDYRLAFWLDIAFLLVAAGVVSFQWSRHGATFWIWLVLGVWYVWSAVRDYRKWKEPPEAQPWDGKPLPDPDTWVYDAKQGVWIPPAPTLTRISLDKKEKDA